MKEEEARLQSYRCLIKRSPALLQALRYCLKTNPNLSRDERLYLHTMTPVITEYTEWVLNQAYAAGRKRLYFLARDAYPVYLTAKRLCAARSLPIDCRYLKVSRSALRMAEYSLMGEDCVDRLCVGGIRVTLRSILARTGLGEKAEDYAGMLGMAGQEDRILSYANVMALKPRLRACAPFQEEVQRRSKRAFPTVSGYLKQEGLLDDIPYALVDSGWIGTMQETLQRLLSVQKPGIRLQGYYFGLYELPPAADSACYHSFYFSPKSEMRRKVYFSNCLFETLCSAPHGMTMAYQADGNVYRPVEDGMGLNPDAMLRYCVLIDQFAYTYSKITVDDDRIAPAGTGRSVCSQPILQQLMGSPQRWEAQAFGFLLFCDDIIEKNVQPVAAPLTPEQIRSQHFVTKAFIMLGLKKGQIHESAWIEGSIVLADCDHKAELFQARLYKNFVYLRKLLRNA